MFAGSDEVGEWKDERKKWTSAKTDESQVVFSKLSARVYNQVVYVTR
jgi:hypothetical protein